MKMTNDYGFIEIINFCWLSLILIIFIFELITSKILIIAFSCKLIDYLLWTKGSFLFSTSIR